MDIKIVLNPGDAIIAPPNMKDPRFKKCVILMTKVNEHGSQGFVLNRRTNHGVNTLIEDTGYSLDVDYPLFWGGPVNPNTVWMLHDSGWGLEQTMPINQDWAMTSHKNMFEAIKLGHIPNRFRIFYGFAAWGMDQLQNEIKGDYPWNHDASWLLLHKPDPDWLADREEEDLWVDSITFAADQTVANWL